jgi:hypothetical protein
MKKILFILILFFVFLANAEELTIKEEMAEIIEVYKIVETTDEDFLYQLYSEDLEKMMYSLLNRLLISIRIGKQSLILEFIENYENIDEEYRFLFKNYLIVLTNQYVKGE